MEFFDSKQEVIDIRLTQFGKRLLAKGAFKPVFYQFFDDDILYNSEKAGFSEEQNSAEDRIIETPRLKTMHVNSGVETNFKQEQKLIETGSLPVYQQIKEDEQPQVAQKLLTYSLEKNEINSQEAPRLQLGLNGSYIYSTSSSLTIDGVTLPIPQLNLTSSYTIVRDTRNAIDKIPQVIVDSENYLELTADEVEFLDKSRIIIRRQDLIIDVDEFGVDLGLDNFEIEIFEITEEKKENPNGETVTKENLRKLSSRQEIKKYFDIRTDSMVSGFTARSRDGRRAPRGRSVPIHLRGDK